MGSLKSETKMSQDHFSVMPGRPHIGNAITIDATKGPNDFIADQVNLNLTLGEETYDDIINKAKGFATAERERRQKKQQLANAQAKELYDSQHDPLSNFVRAYLSKDPSALAEYFQHENPDALCNILDGLNGNERHYNSIFHGNVYHAIQVLNYQIAMHARNSIFTKIKEKPGVP
jgi:hypothetical protein